MPHVQVQRARVDALRIPKNLLRALRTAQWPCILLDEPAPAEVHGGEPGVDIVGERRANLGIAASELEHPAQVVDPGLQRRRIGDVRELPVPPLLEVHREGRDAELELRIVVEEFREVGLVGAERAVGPVVARQPAGDHRRRHRVLDEPRERRRVVVQPLVLIVSRRPRRSPDRLPVQLPSSEDRFPVPCLEAHERPQVENAGLSGASPTSERCRVLQLAHQRQVRACQRPQPKRPRHRGGVIGAALEPRQPGDFVRQPPIVRPQARCGGGHGALLRRPEWRRHGAEEIAELRSRSCQGRIEGPRVLDLVDPLGQRAELTSQRRRHDPLVQRPCKCCDQLRRRNRPQPIRLDRQPHPKPAVEDRRRDVARHRLAFELERSGQPVD
ncbi:MAG: hypothetical protein IPI02_11985 [Sterolibacteriaceae bacterium]|nr:hypothetical protein [Sterolibacteriaceae bacterium]